MPLRRGLAPVIALALLIIAAGCGREAAVAPADAGMAFDFAETVSPGLRAEIAEDAALAERWLRAEAGLALPALRLTAGPDATAYTASLSRRYTMTAAEAETFRRMAGTANALTIGRDIFIAVDERWESLSRGQRRFTVAHELFHTVQYLLAGNGRDIAAVPGPAWLVEGSADYMAARVVEWSLGQPLDSFRGERIAMAARLAQPLASLEAFDDGTRGRVMARYVFGFLAADALVQRSGLGSLPAFWRLCGTGATPAAAFSAAFGLGLAAFYAEFAALLEGG